VDPDLEHFVTQVAKVHEDDWREYAACSSRPEVSFFDESQEELARSICADCSVRIECLDNALVKRYLNIFRHEVLDEGQVLELSPVRRQKGGPTTRAGLVLLPGVCRAEDSDTPEQAEEAGHSEGPQEDRQGPGQPPLPVLWAAEQLVALSPHRLQE
jgi:hypothetical protein